jgi:hypothetical protein
MSYPQKQKFTFLLKNERKEHEYECSCIGQIPTNDVSVHVFIYDSKKEDHGVLTMIQLIFSPNGISFDVST